MKRTIKKKRYSKKQNKSKRKFSRKQNKSKRKYSKKQNKSKRKKTIRGGALGDNTCLPEQRELEKIIRENEDLVEFSTEINNQNEELKDQNNVLKGQNDVLTTEKEGLEKANADLRVLIQELRANFEVSETEINAYKRELAKRAEIIKALQEKNKSFGDIKCNDQELLDKIKELKGHLSKHFIKTKDLENENALLKGDIDELKKENSDLSEANTKIYQEKIENNRGSKAALNQSKKITRELTEKLTQANDKLEIYEREIEKYKTSISENDSKIKNLQTQLGVSRYNTENEDFLQFKSDIRSIINPSYIDDKQKEFDTLNLKFKKGVTLARELLGEELSGDESGDEV